MKHQSEIINSCQRMVPVALQFFRCSSHSNVSEEHLTSFHSAVQDSCYKPKNSDDKMVC